MSIKISASWLKVLSSEFEKLYFKDLISFIEEEYQDSICYPPKSEIFSAFDFCSFDDLKVVVIGQDPYHGFGTIAIHAGQVTSSQFLKLIPRRCESFVLVKKDFYQSNEISCFYIV